MSDPEVLIVGGGIGGLSLAIALAQRGRPPLVVDIRPDWNIAGWGVSITGPMLRALDQIGVADACLEAGYGVTEVTNCTVDDEVVGVIELPLLNGPGRPSQLGIFRPVLHRVLLARAAELGVEIRLATTIDALDDDGERIAASLSDAPGASFDVVVGADGVHSRVRPMLGIEAEPEFTGQVVWRAVIERPAWGTSLHTWAGPAHNTGMIPISADHAYVFLTETTDRYAHIPDDQLAPRMRELLTAFSGRIGDLRETIVESEAVVRRPVEAVLVPQPWHRGRVALIGDAVHSPSPQLVSGAALAVEDAIVLAEELRDASDVESALSAFGERRYQRARMVVENSVAIGRLERANRHAEIHVLQGETWGALAAAI
jgi:2-polyprenyl-6-methoxyphenol hydroxylase-like FAD-dependent oxidoreductase